MPGLDRVLHGLMPGDNLVWQVESLADFTPFVGPFCQAALAQGGQSDLLPLRRPRAAGARIAAGPRSTGSHGDDEFEPFVTEVHGSIQAAGPGACFVFDCLSTLVEVWCSDRMLGNFFMLTCPSRPREPQSLAYFPLIRHCHSFHASTPIAETTQILIDVYRHQGQLYVHPTKVEQPLLVHDEHAAPLGRRPVPAGDRKLDDRRNPHLAALGRAGIGPPAAWASGRAPSSRPRRCWAEASSSGELPGRRPPRRHRSAPSCCTWPSRATTASSRLVANATSRCPTCWKSGNA